MAHWIKDQEHLRKVQEEHKGFLVLVFYGGFSLAAKRALAELEEFSKENQKIPLYILDVEKVKGVHKQFGVEKVPTVIALEKGKVTRCIDGVQSAQFYARILSGAEPSRHKKDGKGISHSVVVYSGPGCPACGSVKSYLRRRGVFFREVNVAQDQRAAEKLVRRSGQMAVPQIDIDGHLVVGFDQAKLERLL